MEQLTQHREHDRHDALPSRRIAAWIVAQHQDLRPARRTRPRIGILASRGYLRDGGWPIYGGDAPIVHAVLDAGGCPCLIPALPVLEGYDPFQLLTDDPAFEVFFHLLWPVVGDLDGVIFTGGGDLYSCLYQQSPHPRAEETIPKRVLTRRLVLFSAPGAYQRQKASTRFGMVSYYDRHFRSLKIIPSIA